MAKIESIKEIQVELLQPYEKNAKQHSESQIQKIADSISEFGFISPCLIDKDNRIIAGHGGVEAAKILGMETVPCVYIEGLTDVQRRAYILADNRLTELGDWDMDLVQDELSFLNDEGFDIDLTGFDFLGDEEEEIIEDEYDDTLPEEPIAKAGQIYQLGEHRLMCGDSTSPEDVDKLIGGVQVDMVFTDPPYGVRATQAQTIQTAENGT